MSQPHLAVDVTDLKITYPGAERAAVDELSLQIRRGEIFGLLGPNGAGKTTTIKALTTRFPFDHGTVHVGGFDVQSDPVSTRRVIGVVPQYNNLDRALNPLDNLVYHGAYHVMPASDRKAKARDLLERFGLAEQQKARIQTLSGGMAQRLIIARSLMHEPDVLFLDEPSTGLDPQSRLFVWDLLKALPSRGTTVLITTHDMEEAERLCDRVAIIDRGKILACDSPSALRRSLPGSRSLQIEAEPPHDAADRTAAEQALVATLETLPGIESVERMEASTKAPEQPSAHAPGGPPQQHRAGRRPDTAAAQAAAQTEGTADGAAVDATESGPSRFLIMGDQEGGLLAELTARLHQERWTLRNAALSEPTLEDVFISLTGRALRA